MEFSRLLAFTSSAVGFPSGALLQQLTWNRLWATEKKLEVQDLQVQHPPAASRKALAD